ncbi:MAG: DUF4056 domain-containing protein [Gammaproteobacteria bacterium]
MTWEFAFSPEPFPWFPESTWEGEANRSSPDYIRWLQSSLNRVMGLRLAVDGIEGPATRSAVRSFQQQQGLAVDGIVGPNTEAALKSALSGASMSAITSASVPQGEACEVLDNFDFDRDQLKPEHRPKLDTISRRVINSQISSVRIIGYTDPIGDRDYNFRLGKRRAERVALELRRTVERMQPGSGGQLAITVESSGEVEKISNNPAQNRHVQICLPPMTVRPGTPDDTGLQPIPQRFCCLLAPQQVNSLTQNDNIADPLNLGQHGSWNEVNGIIYSGRAGFLDLAHIRDSCDTTKYIFDQLAQGVMPRTVLVKRTRVGISPGVLGIAIVHKRPLRPIDLARVIAYDAGLGHEIATYYDMGIFGVDVGGHNSSFSPEDLCSNFLGTLLAERAIAAGGNFNHAATAELNTLIRDLDGQIPSETLRAFNLINGHWVWFSRTNFYRSVTLPGYLRRRNFTSMPWVAGHPSDKPPPPYVTAPLPDVGYIYTYTHMEEQSTRRLNVLFPRYIAQIKQDAAARYGPRFDSP